MASRAGFAQADREYFPEEQRGALKRAIGWQVFTICYTACTITLVAFVLGGSQAMKTAWIEDMLSLIPQVMFLAALLFIRRAPTRQHPYGWHRVMGVGHLVAGVALLAVGLHLALEAGTGLISAEKPEIGEIELLGRSVWLGWVMVVVMAVIIVGPVLLYGPAKSRLAPVLHNKLLFADADMAKADWQTNVASIVGVLGVGIGLWWLDGVAALFIAAGIVWDGVKNTGVALQDLMDQQARSVDGKGPHPLAAEVLDHLHAQPWIAEAALRLRDQGQVFHVEVFVRPRTGSVTLEQLGALSASVSSLDWKIHDVVIVPTDPLPDYACRAEDAGSGEADGDGRRFRAPSLLIAEPEAHEQEHGDRAAEEPAPS